MREYIFNPLKMDTAYVNNDTNIILHRAAGYNLNDQGVINNKFFTSSTFNSQAAGSLSFTVLDLAKWDASLYTTKLLKKHNRQLLWTSVKLKDGSIKNYGFGWGIENINKYNVIEHGGELDGFTAFISRYLDEKLTIIMLTNLSGNVELRSMVHNVADTYMKNNNKDGMLNDDCS